MKLRRFFLGAACAILAACSQPARGSDALTLVQQWEPRSLNPALENGTSSTEWSMLVFSYLVKYDDRGRLVPDVAEAVPTLKNGGVSSDGKTITYHLHRGVRFADGTQLTARDAAWSIDAINDPRNNVQSRFAYDQVARAEAPDDSTLVLHMKRAFPPAVVVIEAPQGFPILPSRAVKNAGDFNTAGFNTQPFGSGPYRVLEWEHGDRVVLRANPYYWHGVPDIRQITIRFIPNAQTALDLLRTHEADGYFDEQDYANYPVLQAISGYRVTSTPQNAVGAIIFNTQDPVTGDARVRHALAEALDIPTLVRKVYRGALDGTQPGRGLFLWTFDPRAYPDVPYDPSDAARLLDAAGWRAGSDGIRRKNGEELAPQLIIQAATPGDAAMAANIVNAERAIGARVSLKQFNITQFVAPASEGGPVYGGKFQMALYSFENGDDPDTSDQFACANVPPNGYNKSRFCDPAADALLKRGLSTFDPAARTATYAALQRRLYASLPIALLYRRTQINAFTERLAGQTTSLSGAFWNVAAWRLAAKSASLAQPAAAADAAEDCTPRVFLPHGDYRATITPLRGPGLVLSGGGTTVPAQFAWMHRTLTGSAARGGNVVVLQAYTDEDSYGPEIEPLGPFQSVRTIGIPPCASRAAIDALAPYVSGADAVFFAGGDQAHYAAWKDTALLAAVRRIWGRGGVIGGTSAGLAIQGAVGYDSVAADNLHPNDDDFAVTTPFAVRNPFAPEISFTTLFAWPPLRNTITDTHFARRDRFGRLVAFIARLDRARAVPLRGLAVDERSVLVVDKTGEATLLEYHGSGYRTRGAWLLTGINATRMKPLEATLHVLHVGNDGERVNLYTGQAGGKRYDVRVDGTLPSFYRPNPYSGEQISGSPP